MNLEEPRETKRRSPQRLHCSSISGSSDALSVSQEDETPILEPAPILVRQFVAVNQFLLESFRQSFEPGASRGSIGRFKTFRLAAFIAINPRGKNFAGSRVSKLMSEFKVPSNVNCGASRHRSIRSTIPSVRLRR